MGDMPEGVDIMVQDQEKIEVVNHIHFDDSMICILLFFILLVLWWSPSEYNHKKTYCQEMGNILYTNVGTPVIGQDGKPIPCKHGLSLKNEEI